jgi:hypothetical protein
MFLKSGTCSAFEILSGIGWLEKKGLFTRIKSIYEKGQPYLLADLVFHGGA